MNETPATPLASVLRFRNLACAATLLAGVGIAWMDTRPRWDDAGITAATVVLASAASAAARTPVWLAPVLVAGPMILAEIGGGGGVLLSLLFAVVGALVGWGVRKVI